MRRANTYWRNVVQNREERLPFGYQSIAQQAHAHITTGACTLFISMRLCNYLLSYLQKDKTNFPTYLDLMIITCLLKHICDGYDALSLPNLKHSFNHLRANNKPLPSDVCLFKSRDVIYRQHRDTILGTAVIGIIFFGDYASYSTATFIASCALTLQLIKEFFNNLDKGFGAKIYTGEEVLEVDRFRLPGL